MASLENYTKGIEKLFFVDFHTGVPSYQNDDSILLQCDDDNKIKEKFGDRINDIGFADTAGTFDSVVRRLFSEGKNVKKYMFCQEVLTIYPTTTFLLLYNVLIRTIEENQEYHFGSKDINAPARLKYFDAFYIDTIEWKEKVVRAAYDAFVKGIEILNAP